MQPGQPGMLPGFPYQGGAQFADGSPGAAPAPPQPEPEMVFQWVDAAPQQRYLQPPPPSPYFPMDANRPMDPMVPQGPHGYPPSHLGPVGPGMDPNYPLGPYGMPGPAVGQHGQRKGQGRSGPGGSYFDQQGFSRGPMGGGAMGNTRGVRGGGDDGKGRSKTSQTTARQPNDSGGRRAPAPSPDQQLEVVLEKMGGTEGVRKMLVSILESLYEDRIKPMANYVKGRLKERSMAEPIVKSFVDLYAQHPDLFIVQPPATGSQADEATIFFVKDPEWFKGWVDIDAPEDPYDEKIWEELAKFLDGEHTFAGGRYGMARELMQRKLPFLEPLSLGEVCHMVQLAIQPRRLIVYHRKLLKPIQMVLCQQSPEEGDEEGEDIKDMDDLCTVLFRMLARHPQGIRLCRMKQMIKQELSRKLSEMAFQCTKLIELFNQEPLSTTFVLDTEADGKSICVRFGDPEKFSDLVKQLYAAANAAEGKLPAPSA